MQKQTEIYMKQKSYDQAGDGVLVGLSGERIPSVFAFGTLEAAGRRFRFPCGRSMSITGCARAEADRDAAFSRMLCERLEVPFL